MSTQSEFGGEDDLSVRISLWSPPALSLRVETSGSEPWESMLRLWPSRLVFAGWLS